MRGYETYSGLFCCGFSDDANIEPLSCCNKDIMHCNHCSGAAVYSTRRSDFVKPSIVNSAGCVEHIG